MDDTHQLQGLKAALITPTTVRYIKLGPAGTWFKHALSNNFIELGHAAVSHEMAQAADPTALRAAFVAAGAEANATAFANEILAFTTLPETALWITFERGLMWWAFAEPELVDLPRAANDLPHGVRGRRLVSPWRCDDAAGQPLRIESLSGGLTSLASYRRSICRVKFEDHAVRRINSIPSPLVLKAAAAREACVSVTAEMIAQLHPSDFELLIDLIFAQSGWTRASALGGQQADVDLVLVQRATGERAFVQVKSRADRLIFEDYLRRYRESRGVTRMFFACHSPEGEWPACEADVAVWSGETLASQAVDAGLFAWLTERTR
ncbi:MAG: restriction endonuclease [Terricaulis sp.]